MGEITVCPECGSCEIRRRSARCIETNAAGARYHCADCEARFDEPDTRPRKAEGGPTPGTAARALVEADPGVIGEGSVLACPECDDSGIRRTGADTARGTNHDSVWHCEACGERFTSPLRRPPRDSTGSRRNGLARTLETTDADDLIPDGGDGRLEIITEPGSRTVGTAGLGVRYRPDAREGERVTVETLWPGGDADPAWVHEGDLGDLIYALMGVHLDIMDRDDREVRADGGELPATCPVCEADIDGDAERPYQCDCGHLFYELSMDGGARECHACGAETEADRCPECHAAPWTDYPVDHDAALNRASRLRDAADSLETQTATDGGTAEHPEWGVSAPVCGVDGCQETAVAGLFRRAVDGQSGPRCRDCLLLDLGVDGA